MNTHEDLPISSATVPADAFGLEPLLDVTELAAYLGVPVSTLTTGAPIAGARS